MSPDRGLQGKARSRMDRSLELKMTSRGAERDTLPSSRHDAGGINTSFHKLKEGTAPLD